MRKIVSTILCTLLIFIFFMSGFNWVYSQSNSWPMFQGNSMRNGESGLSLQLPLKEKWKISIGEKDTENWIYSSPIYEVGKVYVGDNKGNFYCLSAEDGKVIWKTKVSTQILSTAAIGDKNVYVLGIDKKLYSLSKENGEILWNKSIGLTLTSPLFLNRNIYIQNSNGNLLGFDEDGKEILNLKVIKDQKQTFGPSNICGYQNYIYLISQTTGSVNWDEVKGYLYCVDLESKNIKWERTFPLGIWKAYGAYAGTYSTPVIVNNKLWILSTNGVLYSFDLETGEREGKSFAFISEGNGFIDVYSSPCSIGNILYVPVLSQWAFVSPSTTIYAYDIDKKEIIWHREFGKNIYASLVSTKDYVFISLAGYPNDKPMLVAIDKEYKKEPITIWEGEVKNSETSSLCIADGKLFFVSSDYSLRCFTEEIGDFVATIPESLTIGTGETASFNLEIKKYGNFPFDITPSFLLPEGITISFTPEKITGEGTFEVTITSKEDIKPGEYIIKIVLTSEKRIHEIDLKINVVDKTPPIVRISDSKISEFINYSNVDIELEASDNVSSLDKISLFFSLNNSEWKKIEEPLLSLKDLAEGKYTFLIKAIDEAENESEPLKVEFTVDLTFPEINVTSPYDNFYTSENNIIIKGSVFDSLSGVDKLRINDEDVTFNENGEFEKETTLTQGENKIKIEAIDKAGNMIDKLLTVYLDNIPPEILVSLPNEVYDSMLSINGKIKDDLSGIESLKINGVNVNIASNGSFTYSLFLYEGNNKIRLEAIDKAGNKATKEITVKYTKRIVLKLQIGNKNMYVNDEQVEIDVSPTIVEGRTYLPIRWVAEPLGAEVGWDGNERKVTITFKDTTIELWIGKNIAKVNGVDTPIDPDNPKVVPMIISGRTMLPIRFVAENLGCKVDWDGATKTITITYPAF